VGFPPNLSPGLTEALALVAILMILACLAVVAKRHNDS